MMKTPKEMVDDILVHGTANNVASIWDALRAQKEDLEQQMERLKSAAMADIASYGKDGVVFGDRRYFIRSAGGKWKYDHIPEHVEAAAAVKKIEERAKAAYKALEHGITGQANSDGEVVQPARYMPGAETIYSEEYKGGN